MTVFLAINGITIPVADGSVQVDIDEIGESPRAVDASQVIARKAVKHAWNGEVVLSTAADALAYKDLLLAQKVQTWDFENSQYSAKGLPVGGTGATSATQAKYGSKSFAVNGLDNLTVNDSYNYSTQPWTCAFWYYAGSWSHIVETSTNIKYVNGVNSGARTFCTASSTTLTLSNSTGVTRYVDDLVVSKFVWLSTWPAFVYNAGAAFGAASKVNASGLAIEANSKTVSCYAKVDTLQMRQAYLGGAWTPNAQGVRFKLIEV